ncbi:MAG TPA: hypothetical protein VNG95_01985 [Gemmatimonadales bacterium]|nr:hypothetical protein [Gemmatimonadales bacterium]
MLAELEADRAQIDAQIGAVRILADQNGNGRAQAARKVAAARPAKAADERWIRGRALYERGAAVEAVAKAIGVSGQSVRNHIKSERWKQGRAGTELAGNVRCPSCQSMTKWDPCEHCGKAVRK